MKTIKILQGTTAWHAHRRNHRNASDSAIIMGVSPYKTRTQYMHEQCAGITPEIDERTKSRFAEGHRIEALARPLAEKIIGQNLSPVTATDGIWSASYDGIPFDESVTWEHKTLNNELRGINDGASLPEHNRIQMEHGLMVSGAVKCLFSATKWEGDVLVEEVHCWYLPDMQLREKIILAWEQYDKDLAAYVPVEVVAPPVAEAIMQLPAVIINVTGELSLCNLREVTPQFDAFLSGAKTSLKTDDDFANGEATAKFSRATAKTLKIKAKEVVNQISTVSEAVRTLELYAEKFDNLGLTLEKAVKEQKEALKTKILHETNNAFRAHVAALEAEVTPIRLNVPQPMFVDVMKGQRMLTSLQSKVNDELARVKVLADATAKDIRVKLAWLKSHASGYEFLLSDLQSIISKPSDDFNLLVINRITQHKQAEEARAETLRQKIREEERVKAETAVLIVNEPTPLPVPVAVTPQAVFAPQTKDLSGSCNRKNIVNIQALLGEAAERLEVPIEELRWWAWPEAFGNTSGPRGGAGGQTLTEFQVVAFEAGDGQRIQWCNGMWKAWDGRQIWQVSVRHN